MGGNVLGDLGKRGVWGGEGGGEGGGRRRRRCKGAGWGAGVGGRGVRGGGGITQKEENLSIWRQIRFREGLPQGFNGWGRRYNNKPDEKEGKGGYQQGGHS